MISKYNNGNEVYIKKFKTTGKIIDSCKYFKEVDKITNEFKPEGHAIMESTLSDFQVPYKLTGDTLVVDMPEGYYGKGMGNCDSFKIQYREKDILYTVDIPKFGSVVLYENELS